MDNEVLNLINEEKIRQQNEICLIASENYVSEEVLQAQGSILTNKYAEGYPSKRYYGGCSVVDKIENLAIDLAKEIFNVEYVNVQPHSGSQANQAVYQALLQPNDTILSMSLDAGGHLTHGSPVSSSGKLYNIVHYGLKEDGTINYKEISELLIEHNPKLVIAGASAYPREIDFKLIRHYIDEYNKQQIEPVLFMADMAHIAGLVAVGEHQSPIPYADVVTSTTHKTLRGPRGGIIMTNNIDIAKRVNSAVFPGIQGGPLLHVIGAKAQCFQEVLQPKYKNYILQVLRNIKVMEIIFRNNNIDMVSDGTDNHMLLLDLRTRNITGAELEEALDNIGIVVNKNAIMNDPLPKNKTSGIRIGTPAMTTMGYYEKESEYIATMICKVIDHLSNDTLTEEKISKYKSDIKSLISSR